MRAEGEQRKGLAAKEYGCDLCGEEEVDPEGDIAAEDVSPTQVHGPNRRPVLQELLGDSLCTLIVNPKIGTQIDLLELRKLVELPGDKFGALTGDPIGTQTETLQLSTMVQLLEEDLGSKVADLIFTQTEALQLRTAMELVGDEFGALTGDPIVNQIEVLQLWAAV
mmetsp:Transcript_47745/g.87783  ORF Transcript_47745/g.87783 Transcript_47745/m.87783 type:complete len:166 (+) Transcript_47745:466-963(+)